MMELLRGLFRPKPPAPPPSVHVVLLHQISALDAKSGKRVFSPDNALISVRAPHKTVEDFNFFLLRINNALKNLATFSTGVFQSSPMTVLLSDWFISQNGEYLSPQDELEEFKELATDFVQRYIQLESGTDEVSQRVMRLCSPVLTQISEILRTLQVAINPNSPAVAGTNQPLPSAIRTEY